MAGDPLAPQHVRDFNARLSALEIWIEETIFALVEKTPESRKIGELIRQRVELAAKQVRTAQSDDMRFVTIFDDRLQDIANNLNVRLAGGAAGIGRHTRRGQ